MVVLAGGQRGEAGLKDLRDSGAAQVLEMRYLAGALQILAFAEGSEALGIMVRCLETGSLFRGLGLVSHVLMCNAAFKGDAALSIALKEASQLGISTYGSISIGLPEGSGAVLQPAGKKITLDAFGSKNLTLVYHNDIPGSTSTCALAPSPWPRHCSLHAWRKDFSYQGAYHRAISDARALFRESKKLLVFTGAGSSAESGIPTYRDTNVGLWERWDQDTNPNPNPNWRSMGAMGSR